MHRQADMPKHGPTTYEEDLTRRTVIAMDAAELELFTHVQRALALGGIDLDKVSIEVRGDRVYVRGTVSDHQTQNRIPELIHAVKGVGVVVDRVVVVG
jgi:hypothetical protein